MITATDLQAQFSQPSDDYKADVLEAIVAEIQDGILGQEFTEIEVATQKAQEIVTNGLFVDTFFINKDFYTEDIDYSGTGHYEEERFYVIYASYFVDGEYSCITLDENYAHQDETMDLTNDISRLKNIIRKKVDAGTDENLEIYTQLHNALNS